MPTTAQDFFSQLTPVSVHPGAPTAPAPAEDPFAALTPVEAAPATSAAPSTPTSADPFASLAPVRASGVYTLDEVKSMDANQLVEDKDFSPIDFATQHKDDLLKDPQALDKVIDLYRQKDQRGTTLGEKGKAIVTGVPKVAGALLGGAKAALIKAYKLNPVAIAAREAGGDDSETRKIAGEFAEIPAAIESGGLGSIDLARRAVRGTKEAVTSALTPEEYRERFFNDLGFAEQTAKAARGQGALVEALGEDAATLKQVGIEMDPEAIQKLSVLADPVNFIPVGAAVGFFSKVGGKIGRTVLARTINAEQAAKLAGVLNKAREAGAVAKEFTGAIAGNSTEIAGKALTGAGNMAEKVLSPVANAAALGGVITHGITGGLAVASGARYIPKILQMTGGGLETLGQVVKGAKPFGPVGGAIAHVAAGAAKSGAEAAAISFPLLIGARPEEEEALLGGVGLAAGIRAGGATAKIGGLRVQDRLAKAIFRDVERAPVPDSPYYGTDGALDAAHAQTFQSLPKPEQTVLNHFRELLRSSGVELYALDQKTFESRVPKVAGAARAKGFFTEAGENAATGQTVARIFLNGDVDGIGHEIFHAVESVDPEGAKQLIDSISKAWKPEEKKAFEAQYNTLLNGGKPENLWTSRVSGDGAVREAAAEVFGRVLNAHDLTGVDPTVRQQAALFLSGALEKIGVPLASKTKKSGAGVSTLGIRPSTAEVRGAQGLLARLADRLGESGTIIPTESTKRPALSNVEPKDLDIAAGIQAKPATIPVSKPNVTFPRPDDIQKKSTAQPTPVVTPEISTISPEAPRSIEVVRKSTQPVEVPEVRNIRTTPETQNDFAAQRAEVTNTSKARKAVADASPEEKARVEEINRALDSGRTALEIVHSGVKTESGAEAPAGRTSRRAEQEAAYIQEGLSATPKEFRDAHQKVFVPVRWETNSKGPVLLAMSLDKVIANVARVAKDAAAKGVEGLLPYDIAGGKLSDRAWKDLVTDLQDYSANQANGYRGDGQKLVRPTEEVAAVSIPVENPNYTPVKLSEAKMNFLNLIQGLAPPLTAREVHMHGGVTPGPGKGIPGNVKGQIIAEINKRTPETPAVIRPQDIQKQTFKSGRTVMETNPLRNELARAGVEIRELLETTERINSADILSVKQRADLNISPTVTDTIRGGFLPGNETDAAVRAGFLPDKKPSTPEPSPEIRSLATSYAKSAGVDYQPARSYAEVNPDLAKRLADAYESAKNDPTNPEVKASYDALSKEVLSQYKAIVDAGYTLEPYTGKGEPYASSADMVKDVRENKHLFFLKTEEGSFGTGDKPGGLMLAPSAVEVNGQPLLVNDIFRGVHDFFGHAKEGYQFGPRGEFNAWRAHSEMFSPEAQGALAAETLAQNSWVNYGKHLRDAQGNPAKKGEPGYVAPKDRPFAEQKNILIPENLIKEARETSVREGFLPGRPIEEVGKEILNMPVEEWAALTHKWEGGLTKEAFRVGLSLTDKADVARLKEFQEQASQVGRELMKQGDFENAMPMVMKSQFFREAYETATDTGSAGLSTGGWRRMFPDAKAPFPETEKSSFLPGPDESDPIVEAAIRTPGGKTFTGPSHIEAAMKIVEAVGRGEIKDIKTDGGEGFDLAGFGEDGFLTKSGKFLNRSEAFDHAQKTKQMKPSTDFHASRRELDTAEFRRAQSFLPGDIEVLPKVKGKVKRVNAQGQPLTPDGLVDYETLYKNLTIQRKSQEAKNDATRKTYEVEPKKKGSPAPTKLTGWIQPDGEFAPLGGEYHEDWLANNSSKLNKKFGTKFKTASKVEGDERIDALNHGFVRIRAGYAGGGGMNVELNQSFFKGKVKQKLVDHLLDNADSIDRLSITLTDNEGNSVDNVTAERLFELDDAEKLDRLAGAIDELRPRKDSFLPKQDRMFDIVDFIEGQVGPIRTKSIGAKLSGSAGYDNPVYADLTKRKMLKRVFTSSGGVSLDEAAQAAFDARLIPDATGDALLEALDRASAKRAEFRSFSREEKEYAKQLQDEDFKARNPF